MRNARRGYVQCMICSAVSVVPAQRRQPDVVSLAECKRRRRWHHKERHSTASKPHQHKDLPAKGKNYLLRTAMGPPPCSVVDPGSCPHLHLCSVNSWHSVWAMGWKEGWTAAGVTTPESPSRSQAPAAHPAIPRSQTSGKSYVAVSGPLCACPPRFGVSICGPLFLENSQMWTFSFTSHCTGRGRALTCCFLKLAFGPKSSRKQM